MTDEKCCCNCLHCARWQTSKGVECHCDLTDRYLGYLDVMNTDNNCSRWEKETKWDEEEKHDKEIYNKAIDDFVNQLSYRLFDDGLWKCVTEDDIEEVAEQLKDNIK